MAANDWVGASPLRLDRADALPIETHSPDGRMLGWLAGMMAQDRHYHTVMATLTASENYPSTVVRAAAAFFGGEHYFFDVLVGWIYAGSVMGAWAWWERRRERVRMRSRSRSRISGAIPAEEPGSISKMTVD